MKRSGWCWLVTSSVLVTVLASAETRPQYGSTLRMATRITLQSLDPADKSQPESSARRNLSRLMFETLVTVDDRGRLEPALATSWQAGPGNQRWQFWVRRGVKFHDGSPLTPEAVAAALRTANPDWSVSAAGDSIVVERDISDPDLPARLAMPRNSITKRNDGGTLLGTGPFHITNWQPGKKLSLAADEGYWGGRAFVDAIEVDLGRATRDQLIALDLGKADIAEVAVDQSRHAAAEGRRVVSSAPVELMALVFGRDKTSSEEGKLRDVLALSIDRKSIRDVVLQGGGEASGGILPSWLSGYGFVFPAEQNLTRAQQLRGEVKYAPTWTLGCDADDPVAHVMAERIELNARDAGIRMQVTTNTTADVRLARLALASVNGRIALTAAASAVGAQLPKISGSSADDLYQAENSILQTQRVIPLFQLPTSFALSIAVKDWDESRDGTLHLDNIWLGGKP
jgi:peptide/nickel transport system substrate-binding protein